MKYYFPTSTLNFDSIYSGMSLMPPSYYRDESIWFPVYFRSAVDLADDALVLYSKPILWQIDDPDSENYPMLVELEDSLIEKLHSNGSHVVQYRIDHTIECVVVGSPIVFDAGDILTGRVRILFRNDAERTALVNRANVGVSECKIASALAEMGTTFAFAGFPSNTVEFNTIQELARQAIENSAIHFDRDEFERYERIERRAGAEAGFLAGKMIRSLKRGYCLDSFRNGLDYLSWKQSLPVAFSAIIDMICDKIGFRWDVNRDAKTLFCKECWERCFEKLSNDDSRKQAWHTELGRIWKSQIDMTYSHPVSGIEDGYMQALACFIKSGKQSGLVMKSISEDMIKMPELVLVFYGALVGYSVMSRLVFQTYEIESMTPPPPPPPSSLPPPPPPLPSFLRKVYKIFESLIEEGIVSKSSLKQKTKMLQDMQDAFSLAGENIDRFLSELGNQKRWTKKCLAKFGDRLRYNDGLI